MTLRIKGGSRQIVERRQDDISSKKNTEAVYEKFMFGSTDFASLSLAIGHALPGTGFLVAFYEDGISPFFLVSFFNILWIKSSNPTG